MISFECSIKITLDYKSSRTELFLENKILTVLVLVLGLVSSFILLSKTHLSV
jgi:hypothetical protein